MPLPDSGVVDMTLCPRVQELFSPFGQISRIYVAYDRDTGENRGFAFVNFVHRCGARCALCLACSCMWRTMRSFRLQNNLFPLVTFA